MQATERRNLAQSVAGVEIRAAGDGSDPRFIGLASPFGMRAAIGNPKSWGFFETFQFGAYTDSLTADDQRMLIDHDSYYVVSRVSAGTLSLAESSRGLGCDSALDDALSYVADLKANVRNKNITGMSIGFRVPPGGDQWSIIDVEEPRADGKIEVYQADLRTILKAQLYEVSPVTFPAYDGTETSLRWGVLPALALRGSRAAIEQRAQFRPEIAELLRGFKDPTPAHQPVAERMSALQARYPRLRG